MEKSLTLAILPMLTPEAQAALMRAAKHDTTGGLQGLGEALHGGTLFELTDEAIGAPVLHYVLKVMQREHGKEGLILAAAGALPGVDLTRQYLPTIEAQLRQEGCEAVTLQTRRPGLRRKLEKLGYRCDAFVMRKTLEPLQ